MEVLGQRVEHYEFLKSLACAPAEITFGQVANGDFDNLKRSYRKLSKRR